MVSVKIVFRCTTIAPRSLETRTIVMIHNEVKRKVLNLFRLMGDHGKIHDETKFRNERDGIYAFKPQPHRYLCFFYKGRKIIVTNAFLKKTQKLPKTEKERAVKAQESNEKRIKENSYYET